MDANGACFLHTTAQKVLSTSTSNTGTDLRHAKFSHPFCGIEESRVEAYYGRFLLQVDAISFDGFGAPTDRNEAVARPIST